MFSSDVLMMFAEGIRDTLYMTLVSTAFAYLLGLPIAILLVVTRKNGLHPMPALFGIFDFVVNILRSVPFLILMLLVTPLMRLIAGKAYGPTATIVALVIAAAPYVARMVESSLLEVDSGVIEAAQSMGASLKTIILKVIIPEAKTSLIPWEVRFPQERFSDIRPWPEQSAAADSEILRFVTDTTVISLIFLL